MPSMTSTGVGCLPDRSFSPNCSSTAVTSESSRRTSAVGSFKRREFEFQVEGSLQSRAVHYWPSEHNLQDVDDCRGGN
jgi:hypothetical protein